MSQPSPLVSVNWLQQHLQDDHLVLLDASMEKVVGMEPKVYDRFLCIPGAIKCDLENKFHHAQGTQPNTLPSEQQFTEQAQMLGINKNSTVVIYDNQGVYASPRAWWMFKVMGVENVYILNGGLPSWLKHNYPTAHEYRTNRLTGTDKKGNLVGHLQEGLLQDAQQVLSATNSSQHSILDARSNTRFLGITPEPRAGVRSGHIPNSINLPFAELLTEGAFKEKSKLQEIFKTLKIAPDQSIIFSCGSGITACIVLVAAFEAGFKNLSLYDGSWSEWGSDSTLPIE